MLFSTCIFALVYYVPPDVGNPPVSIVFHFLDMRAGTVTAAKTVVLVTSTVNILVFQRQ